MRKQAPFRKKIAFVAKLVVFARGQNTMAKQGKEQIRCVLRRTQVTEVGSMEINVILTETSYLVAG
jgi:hypothetical protein